MIKVNAKDQELIIYALDFLAAHVDEANKHYDQEWCEDDVRELQDYVKSPTVIHFDFKD